MKHEINIEELENCLELHLFSLTCNPDYKTCISKKKTSLKKYLKSIERFGDKQ